ncbi:MAG: division/cell wall cluster transcriptional repressor MraZ [Planctomycetes bacterium]|nr:division/cell wall cluster transcriptional repressor MraZ [Planctomycetota bacterium]
MFLGTYWHTLDEKNRFILPTKLREAVNLDEEGHKFVFTRGLDKSVFMFPPSEFHRFSERVKRGAFTRNRDFKLEFAASATHQAIDKQGRITVPAQLLKDAEIAKEIAVIGNFDWIEIWSRERWERRLAESEARGAYDREARSLFEGTDDEGEKER